MNTEDDNRYIEKELEATWNIACSSMKQAQSRGDQECEAACKRSLGFARTILSIMGVPYELIGDGALEDKTLSANLAGFRGFPNQRCSIEPASVSVLIEDAKIAKSDMEYITDMLRAAEFGDTRQLMQNLHYLANRTANMEQWLGSITRKKRRKTAKRLAHPSAR